MPFPYSWPLIWGVLPSAQVLMQADIQRLVKHTLLVQTRIEERSTAQFSIYDDDGSQEYTQGEPVSIWDHADTCIFRGFVADPGKAIVAPQGGLYHPIRCMDQHYLADKRRCAASYTGETCGFMVDDIYDNYLADEGVGIGSIEAGPVVVEAKFNYVRVSDAFDKLATRANKIWYIDEENDLYFVDRGVTPAPWDATGLDMIRKSSKMNYGNSMYRNRQYVRGGRDITGPQTENFTGDAFAVSFTVGYPINQVPAVTVGGLAQTVGIKGLDTTYDCYWSKGDPVIVFDGGSIPAALAAIVIDYVGQYDVLVLVTDGVEIAAQKAIEGGTTTGYVEDISDETVLDDRDALLDSGKAQLEKYGQGRTRIFFKTVRLGLRPGMTQQVTVSKYGLDAEMLIESVEYMGRGQHLVHGVTAIIGPEEGSWAKYFKDLGSQKDEVIDRLNVGSDQILIILSDEYETWEWTEDIDYAPYACPVVALDLWPALTLYPC